MSTTTTFMAPATLSAVSLSHHKGAPHRGFPHLTQFPHPDPAMAPDGAARDRRRGNNQAPKPGARPFESPPRAQRKMTALPALLACGLSAAPTPTHLSTANGMSCPTSRHRAASAAKSFGGQALARGRYSIQFSEQCAPQRAPEGLASYATPEVVHRRSAPNSKHRPRGRRTPPALRLPSIAAVVSAQYGQIRHTGRVRILSARHALRYWCQRRAIPFGVLRQSRSRALISSRRRSVGDALHGRPTTLDLLVSLKAKLDDFITAAGIRIEPVTADQGRRRVKGNTWEK